MAGDWIKVQKDTPDKPEVLAIASRLNIDPDAVTGKLIRVWSWFDTHTTDGNALSVTFAFLDRLTSVTGFAEQMVLCGWLNQNGSMLSLPNFENHNGETAKKRAQSKNRTEKYRSNANSNASSVTKALPEKRREEKSYSVSKDTRVSCPDGLDSSLWIDFLTMRKAKKLPMTQTALDGLTKQAEKIGWTLAQVIEECVNRGWGGFKAEWLTQKNNVADISRITVPGKQERDPALVKLDQDRQITKPPSLEVLARMAQLRKGT